jgi:hypothetical protein
MRMFCGLCRVEWAEEQGEVEPDVETPAPAEETDDAAETPPLIAPMSEALSQLLGHPFYEDGDGAVAQATAALAAAATPSLFCARADLLLTYDQRSVPWRLERKEFMVTIPSGFDDLLKAAAIEDYTAALHLSEGACAAALRGRAFMFRVAGRIENADQRSFEDYDALVALCPDDAKALVDRAETRFSNFRRAYWAGRSLDEDPAIDPAITRRNDGLCIDDLRAALRLDPGQKQACELLARLLEEHGDRVEADAVRWAFRRHTLGDDEQWNAERRFKVGDWVFYDDQITLQVREKTGCKWLIREIGPAGGTAWLYGGNGESELVSLIKLTPTEPPKGSRRSALERGLQNYLQRQAKRGEG